MNEEIIKKCEGIDKTKEDLSIIDKFEQIYSNFMMAKLSPKIPKIIKDEEPSGIVNANDDIFLDEKKLIDKNLESSLRKPSFDLNKNVLDKEDAKKDKENNNKKNILMKNIIDSSKELITKRILQNKINQINIISNKEKKNIIIREKSEDAKNHIKIRKDKVKVIEKMNNNKQKKEFHKKINQPKVYNAKYEKNKSKYKDKDKERKTMKDIYKHIYGINGINDSDIQINEEKKYEVKNAYERLYNQGFYSKNKSQVNILDNINQIKKDSNYTIISKKSKELLGIIKSKDNKNNRHIKYDKNNIYKPIKSNIKYKNVELSFRPQLNVKTIRIAKKLEDPFLRITKPKLEIKSMTPKKLFVKKEEYDKCIKRINYLYLDGVEKIKKKKKLNSYSPTSISEESELKVELMKNKVNINKVESIKNSRNTYYKQIQWKKKILLSNIKKHRIYNGFNNDESECTFKPQILKTNIKLLFKKQLSDTDIKNMRKKSSYSYLSPKKRDFSVSKQRYFIINNDETNKSNINNSRIHLYYQKDKYNECDKRDKYNKIEVSMIQRKLYNLEKFFSKQSL